MAASMNDAEPLYDISLIKKERVLLVEKIVFENVMPCIMSFLIPRQVDTIKTEKSGFDRIGKILDYIDRLTQASQYAAFNALMKTIGGTQPELFISLVGRAPTDTETAFCVKDMTQGVRDKIIKTGHCTNSELDETICFDYEHVELSIVDKKTGSEPDHEGTGRNISACDILSDECNSNEKVLLFGRAGVGKSTTNQWLSRQWAQGKWATGVTLLFLLQARFLTHVEVPMTALKLLTLYSLYQLEEMSESTVLSSWLKNPASRILIFIDGLDEISGFARRMINPCKISNLTHKAHPIDLIINMLRGDLLPHSIVISASRPFLGLNDLKPINFKAEVLGLTSKRVTEYVERRHPGKANRILSVLERNHVLLSVCGITFYCMMISRLLSEGVVLIDEEVQTYTRLMAFILVQYTSRKISGSVFSLETSPCFSKLAKMAFSGIFQSQEDNELSKVVFHEKDLIQFNLNIDDLKKTGIVQVTKKKIGRDKSVITEFFHLSGQEMLAVLHFLSNPCPDDLLTPLFFHGHFDMALMYTFGLNNDKTSKWIEKLWTAMGSSNPSTDTSITSELSLFIDRLCKDSASKIKVCQLIFEAQWVDKAKTVFSSITHDGEFSPGNTTMTAIDVLAVDFVCSHAGSLSSIILNRVNADATFVKVMMSSLFEHNVKTLQKLDLSFNSIGTDGAKAIAKTLGETLRVDIRLETLNLSTNSIDPAGAEAIADMLKNNTSLQTLNMSYNNVGAIGAEAMAITLKHNTSLETLKLSDNSIGDAGAEVLANMLKHNTSLQTLDISSNSIHVVGAKAIADMLKHNSSLRTLNISGNGVGDVGVEAMADTLKCNTSLKTLNISDSSIGDAGAEAIAHILQTNTSLQILHIYNNSIGYAGAGAMAEMLTNNASMQMLNMSNNSIGAAGAGAIANMLKHNESLQGLDISSNSIGDAGAMAMANMLPYNESLQTLVMHDNRIGDFGAKAMANAMAVGLNKNTKLKNVYMIDSGIGTAGREALTEALTKVRKHCPKLKLWF